MPTPKRNSTVGPRARTAVTLLLAVGLGVGLALGVNALFGDPDPGPAADEGGAASSIVALIAFMVVAGFLALAVHEVGHAIGGRLRGKRLGMLIVGPVHLHELRARAKLEALVETSPVGVVLFDARTGGLVSWNRKATRIVEGLRMPNRPVEQLLALGRCDSGIGHSRD